MKTPSKKDNQAYAFLSIGFEFIFIFLLFFGLGWLYDKHAPWAAERSVIGTLIGLALGFFAAFWHLYRRAQDANSSSNNSD